MALSGRELAFLWTGLSCLLPPVLILPAVLLSPVCASVPTSSLSVGIGPAPTQHSHSLSESAGHLTPVWLVEPPPVQMPREVQTHQAQEGSWSDCLPFPHTA